MKQILLATFLLIFAAVAIVATRYIQGWLGCPPGYSPVQYFDGSEHRFGGCLKIPDDLNRECLNDDQCEYNCLAEEKAVKALGCQPVCFIDVECPDVRGRCGLGGVEGLNIPRTGKLRRHCEK